MTWAVIGILSLVTTQRLAELWLSDRNTGRLLGQGAVEVAPGHYSLIVGVHVAWLAALWWFAPGHPIIWPLVALFAVLQLARLWVIATLGRRWTTRIIVLPGAPLVRNGPYRFVDHPNYWIVIAEIAVLPLAFGMAAWALFFSFLNLAVLAVRIRAENQALGR
ncbi:MAG: isoprenylcysteine carboxylmethyltransferase family protein [Sphingomicrobium sp.]